MTDKLKNIDELRADKNKVEKQIEALLQTFVNDNPFCKAEFIVRISFEDFGAIVDMETRSFVVTKPNNPPA